MVCVGYPAESWRSCWYVRTEESTNPEKGLARRIASGDIPLVAVESDVAMARHG